MILELGTVIWMNVYICFSFLSFAYGLGYYTATERAMNEHTWGIDFLCYYLLLLSVWGFLVVLYTTRADHDITNGWYEWIAKR